MDSRYYSHNNRSDNGSSSRKGGGNGGDKGDRGREKRDGGDRPGATERMLRNSDVLRRRDAELNRHVLDGPELARYVADNPEYPVNDDLIQARAELSTVDLRDVHRRDIGAMEARQNPELLDAYHEHLREQGRSTRDRGWGWMLNHRPQVIRELNGTDLRERHAGEAATLRQVHEYEVENAEARDLAHNLAEIERARQDPNRQAELDNAYYELYERVNRPREQ